jgi:hypothetical protein
MNGMIELSKSLFACAGQLGQPDPIAEYVNVIQDHQDGLIQGHPPSLCGVGVKDSRGER